MSENHENRYQLRAAAKAFVASAPSETACMNLKDKG